MKPSTTYKYNLSLTSQFYFCGIPFRLDTKPKCEFNCAYCFAMARGGRRTETALIANKNNLKNIFSKINTPNSFGLNQELLRNRLPIHFGGMSDPFDSDESTHVSLEFLKELQKREYPTVISTKNTDVLLTDDVLNLLVNHKKLIIQISLTAFSDKFLNVLEPNVPDAEKRLLAIRKLKKLGINTTIRLQPIFPNLINDIIENLIPKINETDVDHIIFEHLKLPVERNISLIKELEEKSYWNLYKQFEEKGAKLVGREWLLPNEIKYENINRIVQYLKPDISYSYADYGLQHLGKTSCCCGIDKFWDDANWFKGNIVNCIKDNLNLETFSIELLDNYNYPSSSIKRIINSNSRLSDYNTIRDYLRQKWNSPLSINAPDHLLGISYLGKDKNSNCLYRKSV